MPCIVWSADNIFVLIDTVLFTMILCCVIISAMIHVYCRQTMVAVSWDKEPTVPLARLNMTSRGNIVTQVLSWLLRAY